MLFRSRVWNIYRRKGLKDGILCLSLQVYVLVTAMTDNTLYYIYVTGALSICLMSCLLEEQEAGYA